MSDTELGRALHELVPEPPAVLSGDVVLQRARRRHRRRVAVLSVLSLLLVVAVIGTTVVVQRSSGSDSLHEIPISKEVHRPTPTATPGGTPKTATDMHSRFAPEGPLTTGTADVDGDGRPDSIVVATSGVVTVRLATGATVTASLPRADSSLRLQGVADLWATGTRNVLVSETAAGCCGYQSTNSDTYVLALVHGRLVLVRTGQGAPLVLFFSVGRGDVYAGITCDVSRHVVTQAKLLQTGRASATRRWAAISLSGSRATVNRVARQQLRHLSYADLTSNAGAHGCPGLAADGWAD